jgi:hypothetical protein
VAIRLYFQREDLIAVHTLATAAQRVLKDIGEPRGVKSVFLSEENVDLVVKPEFKDEWYRHMTESGSFFKHANRDPDETHEFYYETTKSLLWDASRMYVEMDRTGCMEAVCFGNWFMIRHPQLLESPNVFERLGLGEEMRAFYTDDFETILHEIDRFIATREGGSK